MGGEWFDRSKNGYESSKIERMRIINSKKESMQYIRSINKLMFNFPCNNEY